MWSNEVRKSERCKENVHPWEPYEALEEGLAD